MELASSSSSPKIAPNSFEAIIAAHLPLARQERGKYDPGEQAQVSTTQVSKRLKAWRRNRQTGATSHPSAEAAKNSRTESPVSGF
jgi:hypothetical protein